MGGFQGTWTSLLVFCRDKKGPAPTPVPGGASLPCFRAPASQQGSWADAKYFQGLSCWWEGRQGGCGCLDGRPRSPPASRSKERDRPASFSSKFLACWEPGSGEEHGRRRGGVGMTGRKQKSRLVFEEQEIAQPKVEENGFYTWAKKRVVGQREKCTTWR